MNTVPTLIPARMLNEYTYCPRLAYLEWVQGEWADSKDTVEGRFVHRRVDKAEGGRAKLHQRSLHLSSEKMGLTAVVDLIEKQGGRVRPVDYKRGKKPIIEGGAYEPERVQLCAQALLLRERGHDCREGLIYYAGSRERVRVRFTGALEARTLELTADMRRRFSNSAIPVPLADSPKCPRCSLVKICLPDETSFLIKGGSPRPIAVADPASYPLCVQEPGALVRLDHGRLVVELKRKEVDSSGMDGLSQVVLMGSTHMTTAAMRECCMRGIPVLFLSGTGWFYGMTRGLSHKNVELRARQFAAAGDGRFAVRLAAALVAAKIANSRVLLRRNGKPAASILKQMASLSREARKTENVETLLSMEGNAARLYFSAFPTMLKNRKDLDRGFDFEARRRRPPTDPVNALLSFAYTLLTKDFTVTLEAVGFDPMMGFYHHPRYGRPALALDLMEPFRPVVAESVVISVLNNGEIEQGDFYRREGAVLLKPDARKRFVRAYERRLGQTIKHPLFGYKASYRRIFEIQARLLGRVLFEEITAYPAFVVR